MDYYHARLIEADRLADIWSDNKTYKGRYTDKAMYELSIIEWLEERLIFPSHEVSPPASWEQWSDRDRRAYLATIEVDIVVQSIYMRFPNEVDRDIFAITDRWPAIKELHLRSWRLTDQDLEMLVRFKQLESLTIFGKQFSDAALPFIAELHCLESLDIGRTSITETGFESIRSELLRLRKLNPPLEWGWS